MRRTTSLSEFSSFLQPSSRPIWSDEKNHSEKIRPAPKRKDVKQRQSTDLSSLNAAHFVDADPFLNACGFCKRSIGAGIDTFMYREVAFCSKRCREKMITEDRRKKTNKPFLPSMQKANLLLPIKASVSSS